MPEAGLLGGEPFDEFVEEDLFGAADLAVDAGEGGGRGDGVVGLFSGWRGRDSMVADFERLDHFLVSDGASAEIEGGEKGGAEAGNEREEDGQKEQGECREPGAVRGLQEDRGVMAVKEVGIGFDEKGEEHHDEGGGSGTMGKAMPDPIGAFGGAGFVLEVMDLILDAGFPVALQIGVGDGG